MKLKISILGLLLMGAMNIGAMILDQEINLKEYLNNKKNGFLVDQSKTMNGTEARISKELYDGQAIENLLRDGISYRQQKENANRKDHSIIEIDDTVVNQEELNNLRAKLNDLEKDPEIKTILDARKTGKKITKGWTNTSFAFSILAAFIVSGGCGWFFHKKMSK